MTLDPLEQSKQWGLKILTKNKKLPLVEYGGPGNQFCHIIGSDITFTSYNWYNW